MGFNLVKFIQASVPVNQDAKTMEIADWRNKIDELDRRLVELLNERAQAAHEIGKLKRNTSMPIYEPEREKRIFENVLRVNRGPLPDGELRTVYERIIDVMRNIQKNEIAPKTESGDRHTEFDVEVND
jgi:chorismate mutase